MPTFSVSVNDRVWDKDQVLNLVNTNDEAMYRILIHLYNRQTGQEKESLKTCTNNGVGFNAADGNYLSFVAEFVRKKRLAGVMNPLKADTKQKIRIKLKKYSHQMLDIIKER